MAGRPWLRSLWTVRFNDGTSLDADTAHQWEVSDRRNEAALLTTGQIVERYGLIPRDPRPKIRMCGPVEMPARPVPVDPYLLGLLLGDGGLSGNTPILTTADEGVLAEVRRRLPEGIMLKNRGYDYRLVGTGARSLKNPLTGALRELGVMGKLAQEKAVPTCYKWNGADARLAILRGLMDSDGTVCGGPHGATEFATTSPLLAEDVAFLARSLGAKVVLCRRPRTSYSYRGERRLGQRSYRVRISGGPCPFLLSRKAEVWRDTPRRPMFKRIVSIARAADGLATCIAVAHPSGLFVVDGFTVTHNTHQNVLVFVKGDARAATAALGPVEISDLEGIEVEPA